MDKEEIIIYFFEIATATFFIVYFGDPEYAEAIGIFSLLCRAFSFAFLAVMSVFIFTEMVRRFIRWKE